MRIVISTLALLIGAIGTARAEQIVCPPGLMAIQWEGRGWYPEYNGDLRRVELWVMGEGEKAMRSVKCNREHGSASLHPAGKCRFTPGNKTSMLDPGKLIAEISVCETRASINTTQCAVECDAK
jgi:hypothetical protein